MLDPAPPPHVSCLSLGSGPYSLEVMVAEQPSWLVSLCAFVSEKQLALGKNKNKSHTVHGNCLRALTLWRTELPVTVVSQTPVGLNYTLLR